MKVIQDTKVECNKEIELPKKSKMEGNFEIKNSGSQTKI